MDQNGRRQGSRFRPTLQGCVATDTRLARAIEECYLDKLQAFAAYTYKSIMADREDCAISELLEEIAEEEQEHFRLLGELIVALGANPTIRTCIKVPVIGGGACGEDGRGTLHQMLEAACCEEKKWIDRLQGIMGKTTDRVVRALLDYIISDEQRHAEQLRSALE